jgi:hypothetical protein
MLLVVLLVLPGCATFSGDLLELRAVVERPGITPPYPRTTYALKAGGARTRLAEACSCQWGGASPPNPLKRPGARWLLWLPFLASWETAFLPLWGLDTVLTALATRD